MAARFNEHHRRRHMPARSGWWRRPAVLLGVGLIVGCATLIGAALLAGRTAPGLAGPPSDGSVQDLHVTSVIRKAEFVFEPTTFSAQAQIPIRLTFDNHVAGRESGGSVSHTFTIDRPGWPGWLARIGGHAVDVQVAADGEATGYFSLPPGTYQFYCSVYDHAEAGMVGTLEVR